MITRKRRILALLFTAICLLGILPLSVSAHTPLVLGANYTYDPFYSGFPATSVDGVITDVVGYTNNFSASGSTMTEFSGATADVVTAQIVELGYVNNMDFYGLYVGVYGDFLVYIPGITQFPTYFEHEYVRMLFTFDSFIDNENEVVVFDFYGNLIPLYLEQELQIVLEQFNSSTDIAVLNTVIQSFTAELSPDNYVDWILDGYNGIVDVFVNNAKIQYVMDNPIFIIALVVFAMAIAFAVAAFIFKIFRRY